MPTPAADDFDFIRARRDEIYTVTAQQTASPEAAPTHAACALCGAEYCDGGYPACSGACLTRTRKFSSSARS